MPSGPFNLFVALFLTHSNILISFVYCTAPNCTQHLRWGHSNAAYRWGNKCFQPLSYTVYLMHLRIQSAILAGHQSTLLTHIEFAINQTPRISFCRATLMSRSLYIHPGLHCPRCRIHHLFLLHFIHLAIAQHTNRSRSLYKASLPSRVSTAPPN